MEEGTIDVYKRQEEYVEYYAQHGTDPSKEEEVTPIVSSKEEEKKEIRHGKLVCLLYTSH